MSILAPASQRWHMRKTAGSFERTVPPERTVERLMARRKAYGITRVSDITGLDDLGIPVHSAFRPRSVSSASVHSGKGLTAAESLASALAEAVEVDCCERYRPADVVRGTLAALRRQYPMADLPQHAVPGGRGVPEHVDLDWVFVDDLLASDQASGRVLIPLEFVQQGHANPDVRVLFQTMMSAGIASGNTLEEAISHGLCSVGRSGVRRDRGEGRLEIASSAHRGHDDLASVKIYNDTSVSIPRRRLMQVAKWGNSLAIRLPAAVVDALALKEGDQIEIRIAADREFEVSRDRSREKAMARLRRLRRPLPAGFTFDREEVHGR